MEFGVLTVTETNEVFVVFVSVIKVNVLTFAS